MKQWEQYDIKWAEKWIKYFDDPDIALEWSEYFDNPEIAYKWYKFIKDPDIAYELSKKFHIISAAKWYEYFGDFKEISKWSEYFDDPEIANLWSRYFDDPEYAYKWSLYFNIWEALNWSKILDNPELAAYYANLDISSYAVKKMKNIEDFEEWLKHFPDPDKAYEMAKFADKYDLSANDMKWLVDKFNNINVIKSWLKRFDIDEIKEWSEYFDNAETADKWREFINDPFAAYDLYSTYGSIGEAKYALQL